VVAKIVGVAMIAIEILGQELFPGPLRDTGQKLWTVPEIPWILCNYVLRLFSTCRGYIMSSVLIFMCNLIEFDIPVYKFRNK